MNTQQVIGARIRALREAKGLTRVALGLRIGATETTIYRWECKGTTPQDDTIDKLLIELNTTREKLNKGL